VLGLLQASRYWRCLNDVDLTKVGSRANYELLAEKMDRLQEWRF
jgi:hypothetical protein